MRNLTFLGMAIGLVAVLSGQMMEGLSLKTLLQPTAFLLVFGGTLGAILTQSTRDDVSRAMGMLKWLRKPPVSDRSAHVDEIVGWAKIAKKDGVLKLDALSTKILDPWLRKGLEMVVDQRPAEHVRSTLTMDLQVRDARMRRAIKLWESAAGYAPTVGILGTVMGLLRVMDQMKDPSSIGPALAMAFVATFYGLGLANLVFLPIANKLKTQLFELTLRDEMRIEGLVMIAESRQASLIKQVLESYGAAGSNVVAFPRAA